jgi:hypothetical protein
VNLGKKLGVQGVGGGQYERMIPYESGHYESEYGSMRRSRVRALFSKHPINRPNGASGCLFSILKHFQGSCFLLCVLKLRDMPPKNPINSGGLGSVPIESPPQFNRPKCPSRSLFCCMKFYEFPCPLPPVCVLNMRNMPSLNQSD